jgi:bifunctional DNase/RNase
MVFHGSVGRAGAWLEYGIVSAFSGGTIDRVLVRVAAIVLLLAGLAPAAGPVEVEVRGVRLDAATGAPVVSLVEKGHAARELPIWIGPYEAQVIAMEMQGLPPPRPLTHDLMKQIVERLGARLDHIAIDDVRENTYVATIHLAAADGGQLTIDARPSDAIALALRLRAPILVDESVFAKSSQEAQEPIAARIWGLTIQDMTPEIAAFFKKSGGRGVLIADVSSNALAPEAARGDVITALDGRTVGSVAQLAEVASSRAASEPVKLSVRRGRRELTFTLAPQS